MMLSRQRYPTNLTPEHDKRGNDHDSDNPIHPDVRAAYAYVGQVLDTSDYIDPAAWHGWALREAFLAGISYALGQGDNREGGE